VGGGEVGKKHKVTEKKKTKHKGESKLKDQHPHPNQSNLCRKKKKETKGGVEEEECDTGEKGWVTYGERGNTK